MAKKCIVTVEVTPQMKRLKKIFNRKCLQNRGWTWKEIMKEGFKRIIQMRDK